MGRIGAKKRFREILFWICATIIVALLLINRTSIWLAAVSFLNTLAEAYDSLAGR